MYIIELNIFLKNRWVRFNLMYIPGLALDPSIVKTAGSPHCACAKPLPVRTTWSPRHTIDLGASGSWKLANLISNSCSPGLRPSPDNSNRIRDPLFSEFCLRPDILHSRVPGPAFEVSNANFAGSFIRPASSKYCPQPPISRTADGSTMVGRKGEPGN